MERAVKLVEQLFGKLLDLLGEPENEKDLDQFKRKIFSYAITRVLPSTSATAAEDFAADSGVMIPNLVQLFNYFYGLQ